MSLFSTTVREINKVTQYACSNAICRIMKLSEHGGKQKNLCIWYQQRWPYLFSVKSLPSTVLVISSWIYSPFATVHSQAYRRTHTHIIFPVVTAAWLAPGLAVSSVLRRAHTRQHELECTDAEMRLGNRTAAQGACASVRNVLLGALLQEPELRLKFLTY
jgi:hypothetical protein